MLARDQHTLGHVDCPVCLAARLSLIGHLSPDLSFEDAGAVYMRMRSGPPGSPRHIRNKTAHGYRMHIKSLSLFFVGMRLKDIEWFHLRSFQDARRSGASPFIRARRPGEEPRSLPCKPEQVNQELSFLKRLMKKAGCWLDTHDEYYEELQETQADVPRALDHEQQQLWLNMSRTRSAWEVVHWYSIVAFDTAMSTNELRGLRLGDVNLDQRTISIPWASAKNRYRHRTVALENADVLWALERLLIRAHDMGAKDHQHYLFPRRKGRAPYDPTQPMSSSGLKRSWNELRDATGLPWFRPYDTRHTAITRMVEAGIPVEIVMSRAGHINAHMTAHYTHVGVAAQRKWFGTMSANRFQPQSFTNYEQHRKIN